MKAVDDERTKQLTVAVSILVSIFVLVSALVLGWRMVPGVLGEMLGMIAGLISTPFFLEATFILLGLFIVLAVNIWRREKEGDEFVVVELEDLGSSSDLPSQTGTPPPESSIE